MRSSRWVPADAPNDGLPGGRDRSDRTLSARREVRDGGSAGRTTATVTPGRSDRLTGDGGVRTGGMERGTCATRLGVALRVVDRRRGAGKGRDGVRPGGARPAPAGLGLWGVRGGLAVRDPPAPALVSPSGSVGSAGASAATPDAGAGRPAGPGRPGTRPAVSRLVPATSVIAAAGHVGDQLRWRRPRC